MSIYLIRHGATSANENKPPILQGQSLDLPLNKNGKIQAEKTSKFLSIKNISAVFSSPMKRAVETAEIIGKYHKINLQIVNEIIECSLGVWEGMTWDEVKEKYPTDYGWFSYGSGIRNFLKGESYNSVLQRILPFLNGLNKNEDIVVVSHGIVNKAYLSHITKIPIIHANLIPQDNCGVNIISDKVSINYTDHLV